MRIHGSEWEEFNGLRGLRVLVAHLLGSTVCGRKPVVGVKRVQKIYGLRVHNCGVVSKGSDAAVKLRRQQEEADSEIDARRAAVPR